MDNYKAPKEIKRITDVVLMTAIFGGIDEKKEVPVQTIPFQNVFCDENNWGDVHSLDDRTKALFFKAQGHLVVPNDVIVWVDGKIQIIANDFLEQCLNALGDGDIAIMKHLYRKCIYEEVDHIENCIKHGNEYMITRYANRPIRKQVEEYRTLGYPKNNGLNDCCIIARRNNPHTNMIFDAWWGECQIGYFDQTSIQYQAWRYGVKINPIVFKPGSFKDVPHKKLK